MLLIDRCLCGSSGPFRRFEPIEELVCAACECGVEHQVTELRKADYERQFANGYHSLPRVSKVEREGRPCQYRERYAHDVEIGRLRLKRYARMFHVDSRAIRSAVDVGCANGAFVDLLSSMGVYAIGVDPSPQMARKGIYVGGIRQLADRKFDLVTYHDVLEHVVDPAEEVALAATALSRVGALIIDVPDVSTAAGAHHYKAEHLWYFTRDALAKMLNDAGMHQLMFDMPIPGKIVVCARAG